MSNENSQGKYLEQAHLQRKKDNQHNPLSLFCSVTDNKQMSFVKLLKGCIWLGGEQLMQATKDQFPIRKLQSSCEFKCINLVLVTNRMPLVQSGRALA